MEILKGRTLIISDTHIKPSSDGNMLNYLLELIRDFDNIIINGDLWSYYSWDFDEFLQSKWSKLFPLLKAKNTIYIYGNHDRIEWCNEKVFLFSKIALDVYRFQQNGVNYCVQHGHKQSFDSISNAKFIKFDRFVHIDYIFSIIQNWMIKKFGVRFYERFGNSTNKSQKKSLLINNKEINIFGHSHMGELSLTENYVNSGFIFAGHACYLTIDGSQIKMNKSKF